MSVGIRCLLAPTAAAALPLATELDRLNRERRDVEATMSEEALADVVEAAASGDADAFTLCLYRSEWHQGVVGIVAGRLKDRFHRPVIVFARGGDELKGSGRSIPGFHLRDALDLVAKRAPGLVTRFGGHAYAAGLSLPEANLARFAAEFEAVAREALAPDDLRRTLRTDGSLTAAELGLDLALRLAEPVWGRLAHPLFDDVFRIAGGGSSAAAFAARARARRPPLPGDDLQRNRELPPAIRAAYRPEANHWNGATELQLVVEQGGAIVRSSALSPGAPAGSIGGTMNELLPRPLLAALSGARARRLRPAGRGAGDPPRIRAGTSARRRHAAPSTASCTRSSTSTRCAGR
jgi:single-stranded-DNA-specific exonuclease